MRSARRLVLVALAACAPHQAGVTPLAPAGTHTDDGGGLLAHLSATLVTGSADDDTPAGDAAGDADDTVPPTDGYSTPVNPFTTAFGGALYGGRGYDAAPTGDPTQSGTATDPMSWGGTPPPEAPSADEEDGLTGAVEGVVTWQGAPPPRVTTACGAGDNPTLHVGGARGVSGALVFIEKADTVRRIPSYAHPAAIGGTVVKRRCALLPAAQVVAPLPATLVIHGDATAAQLRATAPSGVTRAIDLQEGGLVRLDALEGVVRIESVDGKLAPAWIVGISSPYYAITDDAGRFRIDELDAGTYDVEIWQAPVAKAAGDGALAYGAPIVVHRQITVGTAHAARLDVALK